MSNSLLVTHVACHVKPDQVESFRAATIENARASRQEPGVVRFDLWHDQSDPNRFVIVEVFRDEAASLEHKQTEHYRRWREVVLDMMAEPRVSTRYTNAFPDDAAY